MQQIDDAVLPILETKIRLGLFEHPYIDESRIEPTLNDPAHQELARPRAVQRSVVLVAQRGRSCCLWTRRARRFIRSP
jgi:beta-glucosidase